MSAGFTIRNAFYQAMLVDVARRAPEEACGLVVGQSGVVTQVYQVTNALRSRSRYRMDSQEQVDAFLAMEKNNQELLAIYHSHPAGPHAPSQTDLAEHAYPGVITLIWFPVGASWACRAYKIDEGRADEISLDLVDDM